MKLASRPATRSPISRFRAIVSVALLTFGVGCSSMPKNIGLEENGHLHACPSSPNCVWSETPKSDRQHAIDPLSYEGDPRVAIEKMKLYVLRQPRTQLIKEQDRYLHFTYRSLIMRYVDDVEMIFGDGSIEIRSASRLGHSDLGVNRKRVEKIRAEWQR